MKSTPATTTGFFTRKSLLFWGIALVVIFAPMLPLLSQTADPDAKRAFDYLVKVCRIGPRVSGTRGMQEQQQLLAEHFGQFDADVRYQTFDVEHPLTGGPVRMNNMIVRWHPESKERVLIACHYDTRPYPDRDRSDPYGTFIGANDGGSGVALLMELAHHMKYLKSPYGVDFIFFDGEELIYGDKGDYFLGSSYFAEDYRNNPPDYKYVYGILVDMIGDRRLNLYFEKNSLKFAPTLTKSIWEAARKERVNEFVRRQKFEVSDDHIPLNEIAKIPTCDIIDFDYPQWHTTQDVPSVCSGTSIAKVGRVLLAWLREPPQPGK